MESFSTRALTFTQTVECTMVSLRHHNRAYRKPPVLVCISSSHVLVGIKAEADSLFNCLKPALRWIKANKKCSTRLWATIKWPFQKDYFSGLVIRMEGIKSTLGLIFVVAQFEALKLLMQESQSSPLAYSQTETEELKRDMSVTTTQYRQGF